MERVLGPYLRGGGAKAFNFSALSQDLLMTTLEIPFSVPPYMSLLARCGAAPRCCWAAAAAVACGCGSAGRPA